MKILVISSNLIGDNVLSSGVINYFLNKYSNSRFTFVIGPTASQLYDNFPNIENIIEVQKQKYNLHWIKILKNCFFIKWDIIIDFRSSLIGYVLQHKKKYIFKKNNNFHHLDQLTNLFGFNCLNLKVYNSKKEIQEANNKIKKEYKHVVIFPGGNWYPKIWSAKKFNELMHCINDNYDNIKFIIVGSQSEKNIYLEKINDGINKDQIIDLMGETLTLTGAYMLKSNLFIGNDSGLMHLSTASHLPTIGLFGPTNDKIYAPKCDNCYVMRTKESYEYFLKNIRDTSKSYMDSIQVNDVINIIKEKKLLK